MKLTPKQKATELTQNYDTLALSVAKEVQENIPMYTGNLNPLWKFWEDVKEELTKSQQNQTSN